MTGSQTDKVHVPLRDISIAALCEISSCIFNSGAWQGNDEAFQHWMNVRELVDLVSRVEEIPPRKIEVYLRSVEYGHVLRHQSKGTPIDTCPDRTCCEISLVIDKTIRLVNQSYRVRP